MIELHNSIEIGQYKIYLTNETLIGKGANSQLYYCQKIDNQDNPIKKEDYCVKISDMEASDKQISIIQDIISLQNPHLVKIEHIQMLQDQYGHKKLIVIMERCQTNLKQLLDKKIKFNEEDFFRFMDQISNGFMALNRNNIYHGNIKPENILVNQISNQYFFKLTDYWSSLLDQNTIANPVYMAPENIYFGSKDFSEELDKGKADVFSIGLIAHQLISRKLPYCDEMTPSIEQIKKFHLQLKEKSPEFIHLKDYSISKALQTMLIYDPEIRGTFEYVQKTINRYKTIIGGPQECKLICQTVQNQLQIQKPFFASNTVQQFPLNLYFTKIIQYLQIIRESCFFSDHIESAIDKEILYLRNSQFKFNQQELSQHLKQLREMFPFDNENKLSDQEIEFQYWLYVLGNPEIIRIQAPTKEYMKKILQKL